MKIILSEIWETKHGVKKYPGTELHFHPESPEAKEIIEKGLGHTKMAIPEDVPGRNFLISAGFDSVQSLAEIEDWETIKGIGKKTAKQLNKYFKLREE